VEIVQLIAWGGVGLFSVVGGGLWYMFYQTTQEKKKCALENAEEGHT
jgi:hypothetical protein